MNPKTRTLLLTVLAVGIASWTYATEEPVRTVSVSGTAATRTVPDSIGWNISITETDIVLVEAKNRSDRKMKNVLSLVDELGVPPEDVQTGRLSIRREYNRDRNGNKLDFKHFVVQRNVTLTQRDLERFDEFLTKLVGAADIEASFSFESSRFHELRADTRLKSARIAKEKAESMCKVLGATLGKVLTIDEHPPTESGPRGMGGISNVAYFDRTREAEVDVASGTLAPGAIEIKVTVYATFEIE